MGGSRRWFLRLALAVPAAAAVAPWITSYARAERSLAVQLRPKAQGTSAGCCASCGSLEHTMLASGCPAQPALTRRRAS